MSAVDEARQRSGPSGWRFAFIPARLLHLVLRLALVLAVLMLAAVGALAWRLAQGPLDVAWFARRLEAAAFAEDSPTRLYIGQASIAWQGYQEGADRGLELLLRDVRVVNRSGAPGARVDQADITLSLGRLLELQIAPRSVAIAGLRLRAVRAEDGTVSLDLGTLAETGSADEPGPTMAQTVAELRRPAATDRTRRPPGLDHLTQLQHVRVRDAQLELADREFGATVKGSISMLDLRRQRGGGVKGEAAGQLSLGAATASLALKADLAAGGGTRLEAALDPLQAAAIAQSNPALASLGALDASLQARAALELSPSLQPRAAELHASTGGGTLSLVGGTARFESLALDATATWSGTELRPDRVALARLQAVMPSPAGGWSTTIGASGTIARARGQVSGTFELTLDHARFADLPALWPEAWGGHVRPWLSQNITSGTARDAAFTITVSAPEDQLRAAQVTEAGGTLQGDDLTVFWLRPVPPLEHGQAILRLLNPDVIEITVPTATQGSIALRDGLVRITGLSVKDQFMAVTTNATGSVPEVVTLLRHPRLRLLDRNPIPIRNSAGSISAKISVELPLEHNLEFDQIKIGAQGKLTALRLGGLVAGRDLDNGEIQFDVNTDSLRASGLASVANIAGAVGVEMDFRQGPPSQVIRRATLTGKANARQMAAAGVDPGGLITSGTAAITAAYAAQRDGTSKVDVKADLQEAGLALVGWRKPPGPAADMSATILLQKDKLAGISAIQAQGPGMQVVARADMAGDRPSVLRFERLVLGPTQASGELRFPDNPAEPIRARLTGPVLDLSTEFTSKPANTPPRRDQEKRDTPWIADVKFDRVLLAKERSVGGVTAHAEHDGRRLSLLQANSTGPERVQAVVAPQGTGRRVSVRAADGGALLRALDVTDTIRGGSLALEAHYDDRQPDPPLAGTLDLSNFAVQDAVVVGKLLQAITIYGIVDALRGQGVQFSRLIMPFRYAAEVLDIGEARAFSASLGLTAQGRVDLGRKAVNVQGTVVPAYALNTALGRIPLIGRLFSPERGGGLVAVNYSITGALADPSVVVNPLSALTPGFLRGLFKVFD